MVLSPPLSFFNYQKAPLSVWYSVRFTWLNLFYQMKCIQKLIHLKGLLARKVERPMVQYLGIWIFGDHSLYWTALFYNPISVPVKNILQHVICEKRLLYFSLSGRHLFKHEDHTFEILSSVLVLQFTGWAKGWFYFFFSLLRSQLSSRHFHDYLCPLIPRNWLRALDLSSSFWNEASSTRALQLANEKSCGEWGRRGSGARWGGLCSPFQSVPARGRWQKSLFWRDN